MFQAGFTVICAAQDVARRFAADADGNGFLEAVTNVVVSPRLSPGATEPSQVPQDCCVAYVLLQGRDLCTGFANARA